MLIFLLFFFSHLFRDVWARAHLNKFEHLWKPGNIVVIFLYYYYLRLVKLSFSTAEKLGRKREFRLKYVINTSTDLSAIIIIIILSRIFRDDEENDLLFSIIERKKKMGADSVDLFYALVCITNRVDNIHVYNVCNTCKRTF